jgi:hypothetical protein
MPFARIDLIAGKPEDYRRTIGDVVYHAMVDILKAPKDDRFQVINEHPAPNFIFDPHFYGIDRSADCIFIQLTLAAGRTLEQKRRLLQAGRRRAASPPRRSARGRLHQPRARRSGGLVVRKRRSLTREGQVAPAWQ